MLLGLVIVGAVMNGDEVVIVIMFVHEVAIVHVTPHVAVDRIIRRLLLTVGLPIGHGATATDSAVLDHVLQLGQG